MALMDAVQFLSDNPHFEERPASILEFLGPDYLNAERHTRPAIKKVLVDIFGEEVNPERIALYQYGMFTGAIGIGKTTLASIVLPYFAHWALCLESPQEFYNLMPGTRIAFMQMSTSGKQAKEVVFGDVKARIDNSKWFQDNFPYDARFRNQLRFDQKGIWILPGDSTETTFEGYNILAGILDEADSHKVTPIKDYAEQGYSTIESRVLSRFQDRGFLLVVGQMKKSTGFAASTYNDMLLNENAYTARLTIWESLGWDNYLNADGSRDSFWFDSKKYEIVPEGVAKYGGSDEMQYRYLEIPTVYKTAFLTNPVKALRDLAGMPPTTTSPFIVLPERIEQTQSRYEKTFGIETPVLPDGSFHPGFRAKDSIKRVGHLDLAYSPDGDALGFAMGHVRGMTEVDGESKPYIIIDMVLRMTAAAGREIFLGDVRQIIYHLKDDLGFKISKVTTDGFQSTDTRQQLQRRRIATDVVSVDRDLTPYHDLRDAIYEDRIEIPKYMVNLDDQGKTGLTNIVFKELSELDDTGKKIDHPPQGSKDVADAIAGVVYTLIGDRTYHRRRQAMSIEDSRPSGDVTGTAGWGEGAMRAPIPPTADQLPGWAPPVGRKL